jgi:uncharacterized membrane protein YeaQ/YmgE (transglycosylase-associated protein family)
MLSILGSSAFGLVTFLLQNANAGAEPAPSFWEILTWVIIGLFAGVIAKIIMPGKDPGGCAITMLLGIAGMVIAGFLAHYVLHVRTTGYFSGGFFARLGLGIVGALIILAIYRLIAGRRA